MPEIKIHPVKRKKDRSLPIFTEFENETDRIRQRAYELFLHDDSGGNGKLDHWLTAEREICWPASKLSESRKKYQLKVALAGFDKDDISVTASPHELIIKAEQKSKRQSDDDARVRWSEFKGNSVYRRVRLPVAINVNKVAARFKNGMLKITAKKSKK